MELDLKHLHTVKKSLADGTIRKYYYHNITRKPIKAEYGTLAFIEAYRLAGIKDATTSFVDLSDVRFATVLDDYLVSHDFQSKAFSSKRSEANYLKRVRAKWGNVPILAFNDERIRADLLEWRDDIAKSSPRSADYLIGLTRTVLAWGKDRRKYGITENHAAHAGRLHNATRIDCVWIRDKAVYFFSRLPDDLKPVVLWAFHTSWRQGDILTLDWSAYDGTGFGVYQGKGGSFVYAPCTHAMNGFLATCTNRKGPVFLQHNGAPWKSSTFQHRFSDAVAACGIEGLTFHDIRGTVQTVLGEAGLSDLQISTITGHKLSSKNQILGSYASRTKLMAQKTIATLENTWLADIGADLIGRELRTAKIRTVK